MSLSVKLLLSVLVLTLCIDLSYCLEKKSQKRKPSGFMIQSLDPSMDLSHLKDEYDVIDQEESSATDPSSKLIPAFRLEELFISAEMEKFTKKWDQLEKDLFYLEARNKTLQLLIKKYPQIPPQKLAKFKSLINEE